MRTLLLYGLALLAIANAQSCPDDHGLTFCYPYPVQHYYFQSQLTDLTMAYMDVAPTTEPNNETIVLLHGKNFCSATWNATAHVLADHGYRVIMPDQIGFCKSSKPQGYQFSFQQLAYNTRSLLHSLNIDKSTILGHSMGGMLSARYALMFPGNTTRLVMTNPLGLEDWKAKGVPFLPLEQIYLSEKAMNFTSIKAYEQATYYAATWQDSYSVWVSMLELVYNGTQGGLFWWDQAKITDMVLDQPVLYEFPLIKPPTLLLIGQKDNTAIGKQWSPSAVQAVIGNYSVLGKEAHAAITGSTLVEFAEAGHAPQIQVPEQFYEALLGWLADS